MIHWGYSMRIDEFKQQNPAYKDVPDQKLADALYKKHYAKTGITRADFYNKVGLDGEQVRPESSRSAISRLPSAFNRGLSTGVESMARIPAAIMDAPVNTVVDPVNAALRYAGVDYQLPRSDTYGAVEQLMEPVEQSAPGKAVANVLQSLGERWAPDQPAPKGALERVVDYTGEIVGSSLPYAAVPYVGATRAVTAANAPTAAGQIYQNLQRNIARNPATVAAGETIAATGAGLGGGLAQEAAPGNKWAEMLGLLLGGAAPGLMPVGLATRLGVSGIKKAREFEAGDAGKQKAIEEARKTLGQEGDLSQEIRRSQEIERRVNEGAKAESEFVGELNPSLAERTGRPSLVAQQRDMQSRMSGAELDEEVARRAANEDVISTFARNVAPKAVAGPDEVVSAAASRGKTVVGKIDEEATRNELNRYAIAGEVPPVDLAEKGRFLRDEMDSARKIVADRFNQRAAEEGLDQVDVSLGWNDFRSKVETDYAPKPSDNPRYRPSVMNDILAREQDNVTFQEAKGWRERITTDLREERRNPGQGSRKRVEALSKLLRDFDDMIVSGELANVAPNVAAKWKAFRNDYKTQYVDVFRPPDLKDMRALDIDGFEQMADEAVAAELFKPGNITTARRFKAAIEAADDDMASVRAQDAIEGVALDSLNKAAVRNGQIDQRLFDNWKRNHQSMLDEFPYLRGRVDEVGAANQKLLSRNADLANRKKLVQQSVMERKLAAVEAGSKTPEKLIDEAMNNHAVAARLVVRLRGNADAMDGLRQTVWEKIPLDSPKATLDYLAKHNRSLATIFTKRHLDDIKTIAQARAMIESVPPPAGKATDTSPFVDLEGKLGSSLPSLAASVRAIERGRSTPFYEVPARVLQAVRARAMAGSDKVWKEIMYDPEVAEAMRMSYSAPSSRVAQNKLNRLLFKYGLSLDAEMPNARIVGGAMQLQDEEE